MARSRPCRSRPCGAGRAAAAKRGVSIEKIGAISNWRDNAIFEPEECLALEYAEAMTIASREVDKNLRVRLKQQWDDDAIVELTALIAFQNLSSKFNAALDVPPQDFCVVPKYPRQSSEYVD
jgi:alkylhydroperoxidase family enzyme